MLLSIIILTESTLFMTLETHIIWKVNIYIRFVLV